MRDAKIRVADYLAEKKSSVGVEHVFVVTGGGAMHLNDALARHQRLQTVCFHHEQAAAIAAEGYYRTTQRLPLLNVTSGPGGINSLNGVFGAYVDSIAMVIVSGQVKRETYVGNYELPLRQLGDQEANIVEMARPVVKYGVVLQDCTPTPLMAFASNFHALGFVYMLTWSHEASVILWENLMGMQ